MKKRLSIIIGLIVFLAFTAISIQPVSAGGVLMAKGKHPARSENPCALNMKMKANPCAANPCAANPCAANPCAANPCAANPCAANPCAMKNPCGKW
ncbi:MAG: hypothetical protein ACE5DR_05870 [Thermodesulfobacteriota bacterium]